MAEKKKTSTEKKAAKAPAKKSAKAKTAAKVKRIATRGRAFKTPVFSHDTTTRQWFIVDLENKVLGRAATVISTALRGKNKPVFTPNADTGDFVVAINAAKIRLSGNKWSEKMYHSYSGFLGGMKDKTAKQLFEKNPTALVHEAVWGMLPKGSLGRHLLTKLKVYPGAEHPHQAQKPQPLSFT